MDIRTNTHQKTYHIEDKKIDILQEDWDILIVLDACRYDMFKEVYRDIFDEGQLKKAISPATWTIEWLNKVFREHYHDDITYVSSNVFINSKTSISHKSKGETRSFNGKQHFHKIIDVWDWGWDKKSGTVHPKNVNKGFINSYLRNPEKRFILHYTQPHQPFITVMKKEKNDIPEQHKTNNRKFNFIISLIRKYLPEEVTWKIKKILGLPPSDIERIYHKNGWNGIKNVYKNEIRLVLEHVKMLTDSISANFLITADHGERLGEHLFRDRHGGKRDKVVIEVPWFKVYKRRLKD